MNLSEIVKNTERLARDNTPVILTAFGATGAITTAYLTGKAAYASYPVILDHESKYGIPDLTREVYIERGKIVWRLYIPAVISGTTTVICIVMASRVSSRRTAAITAAYSLSERAFIEYKDKVIETFGQNKEQKVRDQIAQDRVTKNPPTHTIVAAGTVLCHELYTGRYFECDMESLRKAQNEINAKLVKHDRASLNDFYYILGLGSTSYSDNVGWESSRLMELEFSTVLSQDGKPCLAFDYNYTNPI